jgi:hypothetical protein
MKSFWALNTLDKCKALARLVQMISGAGFSSIEQLAASRGEAAELVWLRCCRETGVEPCSMPEQLFGGQHSAAAPVRLPDETPGAIAGAKLLAARERPTRFSFLRDRKAQDSLRSLSG